MLTVCCLKLSVVGLSKVDAALQVRMGRVNAVVHHTHRDAGTANLPIELVQPQGRKVPLRRLEGVCHAAVKLTQAQGVGT